MAGKADLLCWRDAMHEIPGVRRGRWDELMDRGQDKNAALLRQHRDGVEF
jgi:hypothetical protein